MYHKQKGATMWQWLFVGGMVGIFVYAGLQLTPIYLEGMSVKQALVRLKNADSSMSKREIMNKLLAQFQIDQVTRANKDNIEIKPSRNGKRKVSINYDAKAHMVGNLYLLVEFRNEVEI
jgi:hypothetical protein